VLGRCAEAQAVIERSLETEWDSGLSICTANVVRLMRCARIERAERWLQNHREDGALLRTLGACARSSSCGARRRATWKRVFRSSPLIPRTSSLRNCTTGWGALTTRAPTIARVSSWPLVSLTAAAAGRRRKLSVICLSCRQA